jgi:hypothetical protein
MSHIVECCGCGITINVLVNPEHCPHCGDEDTCLTEVGPRA